MKTDYSTYYSNLNDKFIINDTLCTNMNDTRLVSSNMDETIVKDVVWRENYIESSNMNNAQFRFSTLNDVTFFRVNLEQTTFVKSVLNNRTTFSATALFKTIWQNCTLEDVFIMDSTMQRVKIDKCMFKNCVFKDFEAVYATITNTVFYNCRFEVTNLQGLTGFAQSKLSNCLFISCDFSGFPLRTAITDHCVFTNSMGNVTDDVQASASFGLAGFTQEYSQGSKKLTNSSSALELIRRWN